MKEIYLDDVLFLVEETDYYPLFRPLLGYEEHLKFYDGIIDPMEYLLDELEEIVGFEIPGDFIQLLLISNGGQYFDLNLYSLTKDKKDKKGLYYNNVEADTRKKYNIPDNYLIIGDSSTLYIVCVRIDEEGFISYVLWEKSQKEIALTYDYLMEIMMSEVDYYTEAFTNIKEK